MKRILELVVAIGLFLIAIGMFASGNTALGYIAIGMQLLHLNQTLDQHD